jgi:ferredoxin
MRLTIDVTRGEAHRRDYEFAPSLIRPDDEGHADVIEPAEEVPETDEASARAAVRNCPELAPTFEAWPTRINAPRSPSSRPFSGMVSMGCQLRYGRR